MEDQHTPEYEIYGANKDDWDAMTLDEKNLTRKYYENSKLLEQNTDLLAKVSEMKKEIDRLAWEKISLYTLSKDQETEIENSDNQKDEYRQKLSEQSQRIQQIEEERKELVEALKDAKVCIIQNTPNGWVTPDWKNLMTKIESLLSKFEVPNQS